jgi:hypothetical protein
MSRAPSGLAMIAIGQKKQRTKKITHKIWYGHGCQKNQKQKISCTPYGLAMAIINKKKEKQKMSCTPSSLALISNGPKFNGKTKSVRHAIWSGRDWHRAKKI